MEEEKIQDAQAEDIKEVDEIQESRPKAPKLDPQDVKDGAPFAALSYVLCLWILTYIFKNDNSFARFHARQGIVLFVGNIACFIFGFIPILGILFQLIQVALACFSLYGIYLALTGKQEEIPVIGSIAENIVV